nr:hypothetical protein Itr_chr14CG15490 [Ipomoea trifida]
MPGLSSCFCKPQWRKKPPSDRHFTVLAFGKRLGKQWQWIITDNPPPELPVRNTCVASFIPLFTSRSSTKASKILLPTSKVEASSWINPFNVSGER